MKRGPPDQPTLLERAAGRGPLDRTEPLAERMRPRSLDEVAGQARLLSAGGLLRRLIESDRLPSLILWGPPGCGKTTLARVVAARTSREFVAFSAVLGGVPELRRIIEAASEALRYSGRRTILFVDEIHRFNKSQQDAFLPHLEAGTVTLIGATTENPSFSVNAAVLSRCKVFRLEPLGPAELRGVVARALSDTTLGLGDLGLELTEEALDLLVRAADGDARRALGLLETAAQIRPEAARTLDAAAIRRASEDPSLRYDRAGEEHYNVASALIKSLRGSDPDAAIYYAMRMLEAGEDPRFVLRRLIIFASEDVGNADPRALGVAINADAAFRRLGLPEGLYPVAQACLYLASCPKSNAVGKAWQSARQAVRDHGALPVPPKLCNAPTALMKEEGYGKGYRYPHDAAGHFVPDEDYLPDELRDARYYEPSDQGLERSIGERLARLWPERFGATGDGSPEQG